VADERTNTLMISDIPKKIARMRELINVIDRPVDQVLIESRIVIATDTFASWARGSASVAAATTPTSAAIWKPTRQPANRRSKPMRPTPRPTATGWPVAARARRRCRSARQSPVA
jgi:hypothetical protein